MRAIALAWIGVGSLLASTVAWDPTAVARPSEFVGVVAEADEVSSSIAGAQSQPKPSKPSSKPSCSVNNGGCSQDASCTQKGNSPNLTCACKSGFIGNGITCSDINECLSNNGGCNADATCTNLPGGRTCGCNAGYTGNGLTCSDINECATNNGGCSANAACTNTSGSFSCTCGSGYTGNGVTCTDINECATINGGCSANATCTNSIGAFSCACNGGYTGNGVTCTDINECATGNGGCSANATCTNTQGTRTCACNSGYTGDGLVCILPGTDTIRPTLSQVSVPATVSAGSPFAVTATGEDDQSGVQTITVALTWSTDFYPNGFYPDGHFFASCTLSAVAPFPLTLTNTCSMTLPALALAGTYTVWASVTDGRGNIRRYNYVDTVLDNSIAPVLTVVVSSEEDHIFPILDSLTGVPATVDVTTSETLVHLTISSHDAESRVAEVRLRWNLNGYPQNPDPIYVVPAVGDCILYPPFFPLDPPADFQTLSGTCDIIFGTDTPAGVYNLVAWVTDYAGNRTFYDVGALGIADHQQTTVLSSTP